MSAKNLFLNKLFVITSVTGCFMGFVLVTDPNTVALPLLIVPFMLLGLIFYQLVAAVLILGKKQKNSYLSKIIALSIASFGVVLLLLQSLNQLTWRDSLLTGIFAVLFWLYIWRADFLHK